jgi:carbon-monoxide dehydrogenase medium subunit
MIPPVFDYHAPRSVEDAVKLLGSLGDDAKLLAGGHSLLPMMKLRFAEPKHLIDLGKIASLKGISQVGNEVHIGAMTTEHELLNSKLLAEKVPLLVEGAGWIADPQIRYKGTIGGDISHGDPGNDHPALMLALDASFVLQGPTGTRTVKANGFFLGVYSSLLQPDEIMTQIRVPIPAAGTGSSYQKLKRKTGDFATAATAAVIRMQGGKVAEARVALTNVNICAVRATDAEASLIGKAVDRASLNEAARLAMEKCDPQPDQRGDVDYKRAMCGEMTRRAIQAAAAAAA